MSKNKKELSPYIALVLLLQTHSTQYFFISYLSEFFYLVYKYILQGVFPLQ